MKDRGGLLLFRPFQHSADRAGPAIAADLLVLLLIRRERAMQAHTR